MSTAEVSTANAGLGWWPKLVLWGLVIAFGVLYLGSVKRHIGESGDSTATPPVATTTLAPIGTVTTGGAAETSGPAAPPAAPTGQAASEPEPTPAPVQAAESAAFASGLMSAAPDSNGAAGSAPGETEPMPAWTAQSPPEGIKDATPPKMPRDLGQPPGPEAQGPSAAAPSSVPATAPVSAAPAVAPAKEPAPGRAPTVPVPIATPEGAGAATGPVSALPPGTSPGEETMEARRRRILAEYEAMQRAAQEQMRQNWGRMVTPGYPGHAPNSPGYGQVPGGYLPR